MRQDNKIRGSTPFYKDLDLVWYGDVGDKNKSWIFVIVKNVLQFWCERIYKNKHIKISVKNNFLSYNYQLTDIIDAIYWIVLYFC